MKLLCAADLHLGRRPSRVPSELAADQEVLAELLPQAAWRRLVDVALAEGVHAVLLAGDLLDDERDYFETFGELRAGVERLVAAGVTVLAVSGNHDVEVLPRLARSVPGLRQLGLGGTWEVATLTDSEVTVHVAGWSFPGPVCDRSPLPDLARVLAALPAGRVVGLLHCDRDQTASRYTPVGSRELADAAVDVWLLGHVHRADIGSPAGNAGPGGYLGTISPADPGEEGACGAWLLEVGAVGAVSLRSVPLAGLRYETLTLDVGGLDAAEELGPAVAAAVDSRVEALRGGEAGGRAGAGGRASAHAVPHAVPGTHPGTVPRALGLRLRLVGRTRIRAELAAALARDDPRGMVVSHNVTGSGGAAGGGPGGGAGDETTGGPGVLVTFVHDWVLEATPAFDVEEVAAGHGPTALLAKTLVLLEDENVEARSGLLAEVRRELERGVGSVRHYQPLPPLALDDDDLVELLRSAALDLLDAMTRAAQGVRDPA